MNLNPIDFNYIDGENVYPLQDYIDDKINYNNINNLMSTNIIMNDNSKLINCLYYSDGDLIINNSNSLKNILFKTSYLNANPSLPIPAKIDFIGKLQVYHDYNILQPTFLAGYYDVEGEIMALKADGINTDAQITILEAGAVFIQQEITDLTVALNLLEGQLNTVVDGVIFNNNFDSFKNTIESSGITAVRESYGTLMTGLQLSATGAYSMSIAQGTAYSVAIGLAGGLLAWGVSAIYYNYASNSLAANTSITNAEKITIYNENIIKQKDLYSNYDVGLSNLNIVNGFINTKVLTPQLIPSLQANTITFNGEDLTTKFGNYLLKAGGTMTGRINMNTGLFGTPTPAYSTGDRITLNPSSSPSTYPYSIGINTNNLWHCVPSGASYNWYFDNVSKLSLSATSLTVNNNINITSSGTNKLIFDDVFNNNKIKLNSTNGIGVDSSGVIICSSGAVRFANSTGLTILATISPVGDFTFGGTIYSGAISTSGSIVASGLALGATGDITTVRNITASGLVKANSFTENNISLASKYLKLDGNNAMAINANIALTGTGGFIGDGSGLTNLNYNNIAYNALSFQTPLSKNALNQVSIDLSAYSPTSVNDARYLRLNGANEMANTLNIRILNQYAIDIQTIDSTSPNCIAFKNNTTSYGFIGLPGTTYTGNYANNLFLQSTNGIIFNSGGITSSGTPKMIIMNTGSVGINTTNATQKLHIDSGALLITGNTASPATSSSASFWNQSGIGPTIAGANFSVQTGTTPIEQFKIEASGNGFINGYFYAGGLTNGIRINGADTGNTFYQDKTTINGYAGNIGFTLRDNNSFKFQAFTSGQNPNVYTTMAEINMNGISLNKPTTISGNLKATNSIGQISGASSYAIPQNKMATGSLTIGDTSKNFGGSAGWNANTAGLLMECQNNTEIAIHDADTRIASFMYYAGGGTNQFYIGRDMGWGAISQVNFYGNIQIANSLTNKLIFDDFTNNTKIQLFTGYSFGINASTLRYDSAGVHKFNTNNNQTFIIDADGNTRATGNMVASAYSTASRYYCSATTLLFSSIVSGGATIYGWFLSLNGYWYTGYSYLTISASVNMAGSGNIFCWNGRVYLSASGGLLVNGGVLQITTDYSNPSSGGNAINVEERWDGWGNNFLRFYGTNLNAGVLTIKIYG